jgi:beta-aspartyl-peptidase (threonine type)
MIAVMRGVVLIVGWSTLIARSAEAQSAAASADSAIRALLQQSVEAWNRGDLDGHLADNADSITFMTRNGPAVGRGKTAEILRSSFFRDGRPIQSLRFEQVSVRPLGTDHALVVGRFILYGNDQPERSGWFTTVWQRTPDGWRSIHDHSS